MRGQPILLDSLYALCRRRPKIIHAGYSLSTREPITFAKLIERHFVLLAQTVYGDPRHVESSRTFADIEVTLMQAVQYRLALR